MKTIDCRGLNCPEPVLKTKQALEEGAPCRADHHHRQRGLEKQCRTLRPQPGLHRHGHRPGRTAAMRWRSPVCRRLRRRGEVDPSALACTPAGNGSLICIVPADSMGRGSDELGWALLQNYVKTLKELSPLPAKIFFYNGGVKIVATDNKAVEAVIEMEQRGVEIWACGTCLEFFHLETELTGRQDHQHVRHRQQHGHGLADHQLPTEPRSEDISAVPLLVHRAGRARKPPESGCRAEKSVLRHGLKAMLPVRSEKSRSPAAGLERRQRICSWCRCSTCGPDLISHTDAATCRKHSLRSPSPDQGGVRQPFPADATIWTAISPNNVGGNKGPH